MITDLNMEYQEVKFGDICREVKLTTKDPITDGYDKYIGLEHLDSGSLKIKRWGLIAEDNPTFTRVFKKGHILIGKRRPYLKKAAIAEFDGICSSDIIVVEPNNQKILHDLLPFYIQSNSFWKWAIKTSAGSLSPRTKFKDLSEKVFKLPSNSGQNILLEKLKCIELVILKNNNALDSLNHLLGSFISKKVVILADPTKPSALTIPITDLVTVNPSYKIEQKVVRFCDMAALDTDSYKINGEITYRDSKVSGSRFKNGDVLLARITPCAENGKMGIVDFLSDTEVGKGSTEFIVARPKNVSSLLIFSYFKSEIVSEYLISKMEGSTGRQRIPARCIDELYIHKDVLNNIVKIENTLIRLYQMKETLSEKYVVMQKAKDEILNFL